ncbi:MAG: oligosaccharide flippase family protein [Pseudohongiella sp.]|nr:oligosaccharide flippase family protein [Pseudohongiella sp.]
MKALLNKVKSSSLVTGAGIYFGTSVINALIPFLLLPVLTRYLEPQEYGEVAIFFVWVSLIGAVCGLSVHGAAGRKFYDLDNADEQMGEFITSCLVLLIGSTLVLLVIVVPISSSISVWLGLSEKWILVGILFAFCNFLINLRMGQWQVRKQPFHYGALQISRSLLDFSISIVLVVVLTLGVTGRIGGMTLTAVLTSILAIFLLYRDRLIKKTWRTEYIREAASFGIPLIPHILGSFLLLTFDRAIIGSVLGLDAAGYYVVAVQIAGIMTVMVDSVNRAYVPWLFERLKRNNLVEKIMVVKITYVYFFLLLLIAVIGFIVSGPFLILVAGSEYSPAADIVPWLVLGQSFNGFYLMVTNYVFYSKKTKYLALITILTGVLNVILVLTLIGSFGAVGAAYAICISMLVQFAVTFFVANKFVPMPWAVSAKDLLKLRI